MVSSGMVRRRAGPVVGLGFAVGTTAAVRRHYRVTGMVLGSAGVRRPTIALGGHGETGDSVALGSGMGDAPCRRWGWKT